MPMLKMNSMPDYDGRILSFVQRTIKKLGIVLESKYVKTRTSKERLDNLANKTIKQIIANGYEQELIHLGINNILLIGVGFYKNKLSIKCEHKHLK